MMSLESTIAKAVYVNNLNTQRLEELSNQNLNLLDLSEQESNRYSHSEAELLRQPKSAPPCYRSHQCCNTHRSLSSNSSCQSTSRHCHSKRSLPSTCHFLVEQILSTVGELEYTLIEGHQHDHKLRMELERQTEKVNELNSSLETEKLRNRRLVQLIRGVDSASSAEEENYLFQPTGFARSNYWQSRSSIDVFQTISPLLLQQRYDELAHSNRQCRRQLIKKDKALTQAKCEKEELQAKYDDLVDDYRNGQKKLEKLCCKYLRLQTKKNHEIQQLRDALTYASDCVISAQQVMELCQVNNIAQFDSKEFSQNLQLFSQALRLCEWVQNSGRT